MNTSFNYYTTNWCAITNTRSGGGGGFGVILGWLLITVLGFFLLYDLFTMSRQIRDAEEREEAKIIEQLQSM